MAGNSIAAMLRNLGMHLAAAKNKYACAGQSEENEVHRDNVAQDFLVASRERNNQRRNALQNNRQRRYVCLRIDARNGAKEESVTRHSEIDAPRGEH